MRKIIFGMVCGVLLLAVGCQEANQKPRNLPVNWVKMYGDSKQSELNYKMARNLALHREILTALADRINKLEDGAIVDGDTVKLPMPWFGSVSEIYKVDPNNSG